MFEILHKETFAAETYLMDVFAPRIAHSALPGQFLIIKMEEGSERIPLTISDYNREKGTVTIVFKAIGESTRKMYLSISPLHHEFRPRRTHSRNPVRDATQPLSGYISRHA